MTDEQPLELTPTQRRCVAAVVRRLTLRPLTPKESVIVGFLRPGKRAIWCLSSERRFLRAMQDVDAVTDKQAEWLAKLGKKYWFRLGQL